MQYKLEDVRSGNLAVMRGFVNDGPAVKKKFLLNLKCLGTTIKGDPYTIGGLGKEFAVKYEVVLDKDDKYIWRVESFGEDGECYVVRFSGPDAEMKARQYVQLMELYGELIR